MDCFCKSYLNNTVFEMKHQIQLEVYRTLDIHWVTENYIFPSSHYRTYIRYTFFSPNHRSGSSAAGAQNKSNRHFFLPTPVLILLLTKNKNTVD